MDIDNCVRFFGIGIDIMVSELTLIIVLDSWNWHRYYGIRIDFDNSIGFLELALIYYRNNGADIDNSIGFLELESILWFCIFVTDNGIVFLALGLML